MKNINRELFPFESRYIKLPEGASMHYVDEGEGDTILFVHGTPEWCFGYRDLVKGLSRAYRCVAPDLLGFGLSDKPRGADYTVKKQAERLEYFIGELGLKNISIVANDFGGGIAMSYALKHPGNISRVCLFNTWMWSLAADKHYSKPARMIGSRLGKFLYKYMNFPVNVIMPQAFGDNTKLTKEIFRHYKEPLCHPSLREATYAFAQELMASGDWWDEQWKQMHKLEAKPFLIFWGMKDKLIPPHELEKWVERLPNAKVVKFENAGHFVQEEEPEEMIQHIRMFMQETGRDPQITE